MFRVDVGNLQSYFDFDPGRTIDLQKLNQLVRRSAPRLKRYFHRGTPPGEPGMRFKMIGYGRFHRRARSGQSVEWPVIGIALQKNYISVYLAAEKDGVPLIQSYSGKLGEIRSGRNNFSIERYEDLVIPVVSSLFADAERIFRASLDRTLGAIKQMRPPINEVSKSRIAARQYSIWRESAGNAGLYLAVNRAVVHQGSAPSTDRIARRQFHAEDSLVPTRSSLWSLTRTR